MCHVRKLIILRTLEQHINLYVELLFEDIRKATGLSGMSKFLKMDVSCKSYALVRCWERLYGINSPQNKEKEECAACYKHLLKTPCEPKLVTHNK